MAATKKEQFPDIVPCKFKGDPNDELCKNCNGVVVIEKGIKYTATDCAGYVAPEPEIEEEVVEVDVVEDVVDDDYFFEPLGVTTTITAESGLSVDLKDKYGNSRWYKFNYTEQRTVPAGCDLDKEKELLWADVNATVDQQLEETIAYLSIS